MAAEIVVLNDFIDASIDEELLLAASRLWGRWRIPLNISHCNFHEERSEENCWFLWGCGAVLRNRWVQIALLNDQNHLRSSCTLENRTLSSSHVDASHVTQIKIGVWPGTGFEWQMVSTFPFRYSVWEFWNTFQDVPFILENFLSGKPKQSYHLHPNRNFQNFSVNGKQPKFPLWTEMPYPGSRCNVCSVSNVTMRNNMSDQLCDNSFFLPQRWMNIQNFRHISKFKFSLRPSQLHGVQYGGRCKQ